MLLSLFQQSFSSAGSIQKTAYVTAFCSLGGGELADIKSQPPLFGGCCRAAHGAAPIPGEQAHLGRDLG